MNARRTHFEETCEITGTESGVTVTGEILHFREHDAITAVINRSARVTLRWNDRANVYVGALGGVEFESPGPKAVTGPNRRGGGAR